ncbi:MAG: Zn-ribbon domain-containing OB-fold protein [Candidatus Nezhaarchaeales archaeon]
MGDSLLECKPVRLAYKVPIGRIEKFWSGLKEGRVYATKCRRCGEIHFPPVADCPNCYASNVEWVELNGEAEVETFTHVIIRPGDFLGYEPYTITIAKLKEGVKVLAWLIGVEFSDVKVGMKVKLVTWKGADGSLSYAFIPMR